MPAPPRNVDFVCLPFGRYLCPRLQDLLLIGNQTRPKIFDLNIRRAAPLYSSVLEVEERVTLLGYTSDPQAAEHAVQFDDDGKVTKGYRGPGWDQNVHGEVGEPEIVKGLSGEAVQILRRPGESWSSLLIPNVND